MRVRSNPTAQFDNEKCGDANMTCVEHDIIELAQGGDTIWIPIKDAAEFADALKAYAEELAA